MPVIEAREEIYWKGKLLPHANLTWGQDFTAGLPENIALTAGDGVWRGAVQIFPSQESVIKGGGTPYAGVAPIAGDRLTVRVFYGETVKEFSPMVDSVTYTMDDVHLDLVQPTVDNFTTAMVRLEPVPRTALKTLNPWGNRVYGDRYPAPTAFWHVNEAFREAGFFNTPRRTGDTKIDMTCQGIFWANTWTNKGEVLNVESKSGADNSPTLASDDTRTYLTDGNFTVGLTPGQTLNRVGRLRASFLVPTSSAGQVSIMVNAGDDSQYLRIIVGADRTVNIWENIAADSVWLGGITKEQLGSDILFSLCIVDGAWELATERNKISGTTRYNGVFTGLIGSVDAGGRIAGIQVDDVTTIGHRILGWVPNFKMLTSSFMRVQPCLPSVRDKTSRQVLDEISGKLLSSWWVDTQGMAHFEAANAMLAKPFTRTLTATEHIGDYSFTDAVQSRRSTVRIKYSETAISRSQQWRVNLWQGSGQGDAGDVSETFVEPGDDEEWGDVDWSLTRVTADIPGFNTRNGSWYTASKPDPNGLADSIFQVDYGASTHYVTPWVHKVTDRFDGEGSKKTPPDSRLKGDLRDMDMPIIRGRFKTTYQDATYTTTGVSGPYPALEVDCTKYLGEREHAVQLGDFLANLVSDPKPGHELTVLYDPNIELGDMVRVLGVRWDGTENLFNAVLKCLVVGFTHNPEAGTTALTVRIVNEDYTAATWADVEAKAEALGVTWAALENEYTNKNVTWEKLEANPGEYLGG